MPESNHTKQTLALALKSLMSETPFSKISVSDICIKSGMSRKSFYYHFQDKYDLMNWIFYTEFIGTLHRPDLLDSWHLLLNICTHFYNEQVFYRNALSVRGQNCFQDYFSEVIQPFICVLVQEFCAEDSDLTFYISFYTDAFLAAIIRWLNEGAVIPPERFALLLKGAISGLRSPGL